MKWLLTVSVAVALGLANEATGDTARCVADTSLRPSLAPIEGLIDKGQYAVAESLARQLNEQWTVRDGNRGTTATLVQDVLVDLLIRQGKAQAPSTRLLAEQIVRTKERLCGMEGPDLSVSLRQLATILRLLGDYSAAKDTAEQAVRVAETTLGTAHRDFGLAMDVLGGILIETGDYGRARAALERALDVIAQSVGSGHRRVSGTASNLGVVLWRLGEYTRARSMFERALTIREARLGPDHPEVLAVLINLASLLQEMGDYDESRKLFERALGTCERILPSGHYYTAVCLSNYSSLLYLIGDVAAAREKGERALKLMEAAFGHDHPYIASTLNNLAEQRSAVGDDAGARDLHRQALEIRRKALAADHPEVAQSESGLGDVLVRLGAAGEARPLLELALKHYENTLGPDHPEVARTLERLGAAAFAQDDLDQAIALGIRADSLAADHVRLTTRSLSENRALHYADIRVRGLDLTLASLARKPLVPERDRVLDEVIRTRGLVLDEMSLRHRALSRTADSTLVQLADSLASSRERLANQLLRALQEEVATYRQSLDNARRDKERLERLVAERSLPFREQLGSQRIGLSEVASRLPDSSALVSYVRYQSTLPTVAGLRSTGPAQYLAFVLRNDEKTPDVIPLGEASQIDSLIVAWRSRVESGPATPFVRRRDEAAFRTAGVSLRQSIWDPVAARFGEATQVYLVPDGPLGLVSFGTLPDDGDGFLIEKEILIHYLSEERDLARTAPGRPRRALPLFMGNPAFDRAPGSAGTLAGSSTRPNATSRGESDGAYRGPVSNCEDFGRLRFDPLPASAREAQDLSAIWRATQGESARGSVTVLLGDAATEEAFKRLAPGTPFIHLATHGFFLGDRCSVAGNRDAASTGASGENPLVLSGLALAGANHRRSSTSNAEDGILTAEEIGTLDLSQTEWVVLSACKTGVGVYRAGEGVFGLRRAFAIAGAGTLVMSLWKVDDEATRTWMSSLYEAHLRLGMSAAAATREASRRMLRLQRSRGGTVHPSTWGAFITAEASKVGLSP